MDRIELAAQAFERGFAADSESTAALGAELGASADAAQRAWALALAAQRHLAGEGPALPLAAIERSPESLSPAAVDARVLAAALVARAAALRFDAAVQSRALALVEALGPRATLERARLWAQTVCIEGELARSTEAGPSDALLARIESATQRASRGRLAELVIEVGVLRARALLAAGDLPEATRAARRVSRMARVEALPHQEYLSNLLLARVRRVSGHGHLAARIGSALWKVAPPLWRPSLGWDLRLAGEASAVDGGEPARSLTALIDASLAGERASFDDAGARLLAFFEGFEVQRREACALWAALDPDESRPPQELHAWARGVEPALPLGLGGAVHGVPNPHVQLAGQAWVVARPSGAARRVLHPGIGLCAALPKLEQTTRRHGRTELATALLVLAGAEGMPLRLFVREAYGFPYSAAAHDGVLRVLFHRMRKSLEGVAELERTPDHITLRVLQPFLVPDPRTSAPSADRVLRMIATNPGASARQIASVLAMPLRTVQAELLALVADGSCLAERRGAGVEYRLEDTTFSEPTHRGERALG